jgi:hypothetical protein
MNADERRQIQELHIELLLELYIGVDRRLSAVSFCFLFST